MVINGISSSNFNFGNYADIKRQAEEIAKRLDKEAAIRKANQERTGLMKNAHGDIVEISSIPEWEREVLERRERANSVSHREAMIGFLATDPDADKVQKSIEQSKKFVAIRSKIQSGQKISGEEKAFLQANCPELLSIAVRAEMEADQFKNRLMSCKSKEEANQIYMDTKMKLMTDVSKYDGGMMFMNSIFDKIYAEYGNK